MPAPHITRVVVRSNTALTSVISSFGDGVETLHLPYSTDGPSQTTARTPSKRRQLFTPSPRFNSRRLTMHKSTFQSIAVLLLMLTAASGFCHAQAISIRVPPVRRPASAPAPATVVPAIVPVLVPAPAPDAAPPVLTCAAEASGVLGAPFAGPAMIASAGTPPYA